jgi:two-component system, NarL family, nitrate/nitrite response regulator NarL
MRRGTPCSCDWVNNMSAMDSRAKQSHSASTLRVGLVSSEPLYREGIELTFRDTRSLILLDGTTLADAVELAKSRLADLLLVDAKSPRHAIEMAGVLAACASEIPIVAVTEPETVDEVKAAFEVGIRGFIFKQTERGELVSVLQTVGTGGLYLPAVLYRELRESSRGKSQEKSKSDTILTPREAQVLACVARALTNREVARELQISEKTVKRYMTVIMEKLQVRNRVEAVLKAKCMD